MTIRLLEVAVDRVEPARWRWRIMHGTDEIACGYEKSRENAQNEGDSALFEFLSERKS